MKKYYISLVIKIFIIVALIAIDLLTKNYFQNYFNNGGSSVIIIPNLIGINYTLNTGAAFGIFSGSTTMLVIFTFLFLIVFCGLDFFYKSNNGWYVAGFSFIIGGAIGNFIDRIMLDGVRDFIELKFIDFPIFNFADVFLTVGVICYLIFIIFYESKTIMAKNKNKTDSNK